MSEIFTTTLIAEPWLYSSFASESQNGYHYIALGQSIKELPHRSSKFAKAVDEMREQNSLPDGQILVFACDDDIVVMRAGILESDWKGRPGTFVSGFVIRKEAIRKLAHASVLTVDWTQVKFPQPEDIERWLEASEARITPVLIETVSLPVRSTFLDKTDIALAAQCSTESRAIFEKLSDASKPLHLTAESPDQAFSLLRLAHLLVPPEKRLSFTFAIHPFAQAPATRIFVEIAMMAGTTNATTGVSSPHPALPRIFSKIKAFASEPEKLHALTLEADECVQSSDLVYDHYWPFLADTLERNGCFQPYQPLPKPGYGLLTSQRARFIVDPEQTREQLIDDLLAPDAAPEAIGEWVERFTEVCGDTAAPAWKKSWETRLGAIDNGALAEKVRAWRHHPTLLKHLRTGVEKNPANQLTPESWSADDLLAIDDSEERLAWLRLFYDRQPAWLGENANKLPEVFQLAPFQEGNLHQAFLKSFLKNAGKDTLLAMAKTSSWNNIFEQHRDSVLDRFLGITELFRCLPLKEMDSRALFAIHASAERRGCDPQGLDLIQNAIRSAIVAEQPKLSLNRPSAATSRSTSDRLTKNTGNSLSDTLSNFDNRWAKTNLEKKKARNQFKLELLNLLRDHGDEPLIRNHFIDPDGYSENPRRKIVHRCFKQWRKEQKRGHASAIPIWLWGLILIASLLITGLVLWVAIPKFF